MIKLITPVGLLITTALLAIYTTYAISIAMIEKSWLLAVAGVVAAVTCVGTAYMKRWSEYLVYFLTAGFIVKWLWSVYDGFRSGYFDFQYGTASEALGTLAPGLMMVAVSGACTWFVMRHFRGTSNAEHENSTIETEPDDPLLSASAD